MFSLVFVCLFAVLRKIYRMDFLDTWWKVATRAKEEGLSFGFDFRGRSRNKKSALMEGWICLNFFFKDFIQSRSLL